MAGTLGLGAAAATGWAAGELVGALAAVGRAAIPGARFLIGGKLVHMGAETIGGPEAALWADGLMLGGAGAVGGYQGVKASKFAAGDTPPEASPDEPESNAAEREDGEPIVPQPAARGTEPEEGSAEPDDSVAQEPIWQGRPQSFATTDDLLRATPTGQNALATVQQQNVKVSYGADGGGSYYMNEPRGGTGGGTITLDGTDTSRYAAEVFVHEANHADYANSGRGVDATQMSQEDYVDAECAQEANCVVKELQFRQELKSTGFTFSDEHWAQQAYDQRGEQGVKDIFTSGLVTTSNTGENYVDFYRNAWNRANKGQNKLDPVAPPDVKTTPASCPTCDPKPASAAPAKTQFRMDRETQPWGEHVVDRPGFSENEEAARLYGTEAESAVREAASQIKDGASYLDVMRQLARRRREIAKVMGDEKYYEFGVSREDNPDAKGVMYLTKMIGSPKYDYMLGRFDLDGESLVGTTSSGQEVQLTEVEGGALIHTPQASLPAARAEAELLYQQALDPSNTQAQTVEAVAKLHWWMAQAMPYRRGSASIADMMSKAVLRARGIPTSPTKEGVVPDLEAFAAKSPDAYAKQYPDMFLKPLPGSCSSCGKSRSPILGAIRKILGLTSDAPDVTTMGKDAITEGKVWAPTGLSTTTSSGP